MNRPFGTIHPTANVTAPNWHKNASGIRARAWRNAAVVDCVYIAVVNSNQDSATVFELSVLSGADRDFTPAGPNATRLFDAKYNVSISSDTGVMRDHIEAGGVNIYAAGMSCPYEKLKMAPGR